MLDIKIINAKIIDGTGSPAYDGEVGIVEDKITKIVSKICDNKQNYISNNGYK